MNLYKGLHLLKIYGDSDLSL